MSSSSRARGSSGFSVRDFRRYTVAIQNGVRERRADSQGKPSNDGGERKFARSKLGAFFSVYFPYQAGIAKKRFPRGSRSDTIANF